MPEPATPTRATLVALVLVVAGACAGRVAPDDPRTILVIRGGDRHLCALRRDGSASCVQVEVTPEPEGDAERDPEAPEPAEPGDELALPPGFVDLVAIAAGRDRSCGLTRAGTLACVAHAASSPTVTPADVRDGFAIGLGSAHLAVARPERVVDVYDLRDGLLTVHTRRTADGHLELDDPPMHPDLGSRFGCASTEAGTIACWGTNTGGECGNAGDGLESEPVTVLAPVPADTPAEALTASCTDTCGPALGGARNVVVRARTACALLTDDGVACWGSSTSGAFLPESGRGFARRPVLVPESAGATDVCLGDAHLCVLVGDEVRCRGAIVSAAALTPIDELEGAVAITCTAGSVCALDARGRVRCEGADGADDVRLR